MSSSAALRPKTSKSLSASGLVRYHIGEDKLASLSLLESSGDQSECGD